ncbi:hypothetical protein ACLMJK_009325 [Lecanora helva]
MAMSEEALSSCHLDLSTRKEETQSAFVTEAIATVACQFAPLDHIEKEVLSDLFINASRLKPDAVSLDTKELNDQLVAFTKKGPQWYEVGAVKYREMMENGELGLPKPVHLPQAQTLRISSREEGRDIPCRLLSPEQDGSVKGIFLHLHGGGGVLGSEKSQDEYLQTFTNAGLTVISVGYRLAPEHPFPEGVEDCYDVAEWLVDNSPAKLGGPLKFVGGESTGAHLSALTGLYLLKTRPAFALAGLVLSFGQYDLSMLPLTRNMNRTMAMINRDALSASADAWLPNTNPEQRRHPSISPFYADLYNMRLPPAIFACGTEDVLLEDTVLMATRWQLAGGEALVKIFAGAPHGFILIPPEVSSCAKEGLELIDRFLKDKLGV